MAVLTSILLTSILTTLSLSSPSLSQPSPLYHFCTGDNFTANSTYQSNLRLLLSSLPSSSTPSGFNTSTTGSVPDRVDALALCRGDASSSTCIDCLDIATSDAEQSCPYRKTATIYYDHCLLRYSNLRFLSSLDTANRIYMLNANNVTSDEAARFNASVWAMLGELRRHAVYNETTSPRLFAAGEMAVGGEYGKIYGLVQCTRDISPDDCNRCLDAIIQLLPKCCRRRQGGRVLVSSCNFRFEIYEFFNWSRKLSLPAVALEAPEGLLPPTSLPPVGIDGDEGTSGNKNKKVIVLTTVISSGIIAFVLILIGCIYLNMEKDAPIRSNKDGRMQEISTVESLLFALDSIKRATNDFSSSNKLGEGGFGPVYKGKLSDGRDVAVKRLSSSSSQGIEELKNEVLLLAKLKHRNLVGFLGACVEGGEKLLIYEFLPNGSLDTHLSDLVKKLLLSWEKRRKIISGIARGLLYLHEESQLRIIHRDLKASNILLDGDMNPKISDFGTARLFDGDQTQACTSNVIGTYGYMPPEYVMRGRFSTKSDVFSFGVLILELITGRRNTDLFVESSESSLDLPSHVWKHWSRGTSATVLDSSMEGNYPQSEAVRFIQIGLLCVQENPMNRPTMSSVVLMLSSESVSMHSPLKPAFFAGCSKVEEELTNGAPIGDGFPVAYVNCNPPSWDAHYLILTQLKVLQMVFLPQISLEKADLAVFIREGNVTNALQGKLSDDQDTAVKRLSSSSSQGIEELKNEVLLLAKLKHRNLVGLLGTCVEGGEKLLTYLFVVNKSLDIYLSDPVKRLLLNWEKSCKIIAWIARGLLYLHEESQLKIVHLDLKASNILLDGEMNPKMSDFHLASLFTKKVVETLYVSNI